MARILLLTGLIGLGHVAQDLRASEDGAGCPGPERAQTAAPRS